MKKKIVGILSLVLAFMFVLFVGCEPQGETTASAKLKLSKTSDEAIVGETTSFTYTLTDSTDTVTLSGSNAQLASYEDDNGTVTVTTKAAGTYILTVSAGKLEEKYVLTITNAPALTLSEEMGTAQVGSPVTFTYTLLYSTETVTVTADSDKVTVDEKGNIVTLTGSEVGEYEITVKAGDLEKVYTFTVTEIPAIQLSAKFASVRIGEAYTLSYILATEDKLEITANNSEIATYTESDGKIAIETKDGGAYQLTLKAGDMEAVFNLQIIAYTVYDENGAKAYGPLPGFYKALDELYSNNMAKGASIKNESGAVVFEINNYGYAFINSEGCYLGIDGEYQYTENIIENGEIVGQEQKTATVENGRANYWQNYYNEDYLDIYNTTEFDHINLGNPQNILFVSRKTDWGTLGSADWAGAYNGAPSAAWNGWRVSSYKPGISVVEFNGWADSTSNGAGSANIDCYEMTYDLSNSIMRPSQNNNMTTRGDIWIGDSYPVSYIMGITFDAGNEATTKDLENGATRSFHLFKEELLLEGAGAQGERTLGEAVGTATWNKEEGIWEFADTVTVKLVYTDNGDGTWLWTFTATVGEESKTMTHAYNATAGFYQYRLIYGVNYTPVLGEGRRILDLENGGSWTEIVQTSATASVIGSTFSRNIALSSSRFINKAKYMAIYGCDVASFTFLGEPETTQVTEGNAVSYPMGQIDFFY